MEFDSLTNRGEYFAAHYFAERLTDDLGSKLFGTWSLREGDDRHEELTPRQAVRGLRSRYLHREVRPFFAEAARRDDESTGDIETYHAPAWRKQLTGWHDDVLDALGLTGERGPLTVHRGGRKHVLEVARHGDGIVAMDCGWAAVVDDVFAAGGPGRLLTPLRVSSGETYETGPALVSWLFGSAQAGEGGQPPRFVLLLCGGVVVLADRHTWGEGRFLAASLDAALERNDRRQTGELAIISALFCRDVLGGASGAPLMDTLLTASTDQSAGVDAGLRLGLQRSVEVIANEVLARLAQAGVSPSRIESPRIPVARELTRDTLRYLYRILFLLYAEARPELGVLPAEDGSYAAGYSIARLRDLVERDEQLVDTDAREGFHLYASLDLLFSMVDKGHRHQGTEESDELPGDDETTRIEKRRLRSEDRGLRFEPLRSTLFEPDAVRLIGRQIPDPRDDDAPPLDLRLRNAALHEVLRLLTRRKGARRGERGGFVSYRNLGINQLGAVYEGLMSYKGIIADEELCEVAKDGDPEEGSWLIPARRQTEYPDDTLVQYDEYENARGLRGTKRYPAGSFVYRLSGRDRETSASYYTPESLTSVTVELALKHRIEQAGEAFRAADLLRYTICEPALGSGAFLNEAIDQVAEEYLRRRQGELDVSVPTADMITEKQRVKAYVALHNSYGVDLNETGVELAEVSLWLNTMHPGMQAPWFGLHLRRGNSLVGARRAVYAAEHVPGREWLKAKGGLAPDPLPFPADLPDGAVHQFLLPSPGWGAVSGSKEIKGLGQESAATALKEWRKTILVKPTAKQAERLAAAARRVEFLWGLVAQRMEISERAIARRIPIWGADPSDPEFAFLDRGGTAESREQVYEDLFDAVDTPYWRLKKIMDAWCALWFWPLGHADLLDGSGGDYAAAAPPPELPMSAPQAGPVEYEAPILFTVGGEQFGLDDVEPTATVRVRAKNTMNKPARRPARRPVIPLAGLDDWLDFLESMLGTDDLPSDSLISQFETLEQLSAFEAQLPAWMGMDSGEPALRFPWMDRIRDIADEQGILHWELEFARVFTGDGGFDLQVGNPPWVRPRWDEDAVLAEHEPWFELQEQASTSEKTERRDVLLKHERVLHAVVHEQTTISGRVALLGSPQVYPLLTGTQPDLYRAFMCQVWDHAAGAGAVGMVHPDTHFSGDKEGAVRAAAYRRLRTHGDFVNSGQRFFPRPIGDTAHFGVHVYGPPSDIAFDHLSWLVSVDALRLSATCDSDPDEVIGVRYRNAGFDERPHRSRVVHVTPELLAVWQRLLDETAVPVDRARLLFPVSTNEEAAIEALATYPHRLGELSPQISRGFDESGAKKARLIDYNRVEGTADREYQPDTWRKVVLKGTQLTLATPVFKRHDANSNDPYGRDLVSLDLDVVPDTQYVRPPGRSAAFLAEQDRWVDHRALARLRADNTATARARAQVATRRRISEAGVDPSEVDALLVERARRRYTTFYRLAWRKMIAPNTERSLYAALLPPGPSHTDGIRTAVLPDNRQTVLTTGLFTGLPLDYLLRAIGTGDLDVGRAKKLPAPLPGHPLESALLLRTLRLNCLTTAYARLWRELYDPAWTEGETWALDWPGLPPLHDVGPEWTADTPLRTERARRSALVEIDALVAVWLGMSADALVAAYKGRFPVLQKYEAVTWFDAEGSKLAGNARTIGQRQGKETWKQFQAYLVDSENAPPPDGYSPPFHEARREREMTDAHAVFQARVDAAVARGEWGTDR